VRALLPNPSDEVDLARVYAIPPDAGVEGPFVRCNMISSVDGAITVKGRSGVLGGPGDRRVFDVLRSLTDVVLVGAGTVRAENYGPVRLDEASRRQRVERGQPAVPPVAVVTGSGDLDWSSRFFRTAEQRPIIFTTGKLEAGTRRQAEEVAQVVVAGESTVEVGTVTEGLHQMGYRSVLLEGGPALNAQFVKAGLMDELCLTIAPWLVGGDGPRLLAGAELDVPLDLSTLHVLEEDGYLFYRLAVGKGQQR